MDNTPALIQYLLKLSVSMAVVYLFYQLVLRRITFYNWNRWYLLGYSLLSLLIPFIDISPVLQQQEWNDSQIVQWVPVFSYGTTQATIPVSETLSVSHGWSAWEITKMVFVAGVIIMALRLLLQVLSFRKLVKKAKLVTIDEMKLYEVDASIIPFSFGNSIFVNPALHSSKELEEIIRHEFVHVKQRHSIDIIWGELLCLFNWYNPFAWLIRSAIRQNLEFIADNKVLQHGIDRRQYQYLLLKVIGNHQFSIANQFNFSSLKKRIAMMNKIKSAKVHLLRFLFVLPLLAVLLVSFRGKISRLLKDDNVKTGAAVNEREPTPMPQYTDTIPKKPNSKGYYVEIIGVGVDCTVLITDKDHKEVKRILLNDWDKKEDYYTNLYGEILPPPPPDAPAPPMSATPGQPPVPAANPMDEFMERNPDIADIHWKRSDVKEDGMISGTNKVTIIKKNGSKEIYDLNNANDVTAWNKKYGKLPAPPTPPLPPTPPPAAEISAPGVPVEPPAPPRPPKPVKTDIDVTGHITITPSHAYEKTPVTKPEVKGSYELIADTLVWVPLTRTLEFRGVDRQLKNSRVVGKFTISNVNDEPYILVDGKEFNLSYQTYAEFGKTLKITFLSKTEAVKKYGMKGKNGAIEIVPFGC